MMVGCQNQDEIDVIRLGFAGHKAAIDDQLADLTRGTKLMDIVLQFCEQLESAVPRRCTTESMLDLIQGAVVDAHR